MQSEAKQAPKKRAKKASGEPLTEGIHTPFLPPEVWTNNVFPLLWSKEDDSFKVVLRCVCKAWRDIIRDAGIRTPHTLGVAVCRNAKNPIPMLEWMEQSRVYMPYQEMMSVLEYEQTKEQTYAWLLGSLESRMRACLTQKKTTLPKNPAATMSTLERVKKIHGKFIARGARNLNTMLEARLASLPSSELEDPSILRRSLGSRETFSEEEDIENELGLVPRVEGRREEGEETDEEMDDAGYPSDQDETQGEEEQEDEEEKVNHVSVALDVATSFDLGEFVDRGMHETILARRIEFAHLFQTVTYWTRRQLVERATRLKTNSVETVEALMKLGGLRLKKNAQDTERLHLMCWGCRNELLSQGTHSKELLDYVFEPLFDADPRDARTVLRCAYENSLMARRDPLAALRAVFNEDFRIHKDKNILLNEEDAQSPTGRRTPLLKHLFRAALRPGPAGSVDSPGGVVRTLQALIAISPDLEHGGEENPLYALHMGRCMDKESWSTFFSIRVRKDSSETHEAADPCRYLEKALEDVSFHDYHTDAFQDNFLHLLDLCRDKELSLDVFVGLRMTSILWETSLAFYKRIDEETESRFGKQHSPDIIHLHNAVIKSKFDLVDYLAEKHDMFGSQTTSFDAKTRHVWNCIYRDLLEGTGPEAYRLLTKRVDRGQLKTLLEADFRYKERFHKKRWADNGVDYRISHPYTMAYALETLNGPAKGSGCLLSDLVVEKDNEKESLEEMIRFTLNFDRPVLFVLNFACSKIDALSMLVQLDGREHGASETAKGDEPIKI